MLGEVLLKLLDLGRKVIGSVGLWYTVCSVGVEKKYSSCLAYQDDDVTGSSDTILHYWLHIK